MLDQPITVMSPKNKPGGAGSTLIAAPGSTSQPYRFGGRVGLFGHYLRSLKIILLLTAIKLDAASTASTNKKKTTSKEATVYVILKLICDLATSIEATERKYAKEGQRLLFCGPEVTALRPKCDEIQTLFDSIKGIVFYLAKPTIGNLTQPLLFQMKSISTTLGVGTLVSPTIWTF